MNPVPPGDFTFAVPDDWVRIRVCNAAERASDVRRLARAVTKGRSDRDALLPKVSQLFQDAASSYADDYTVEVYLSLVQEGSLPLACALAVGVVPPQGAGSDPGQTQAAFLASAAPRGSAELVDLGAGPVPRLCRRVVTEATSTHRVENYVVQYQHLVPGGGYVVLSFSTPQLLLLEPLTGLFDAVAGSFRWIA